MIFGYGFKKSMDSFGSNGSIRNVASSHQLKCERPPTKNIGDIGVMSLANPSLAVFAYIFDFQTRTAKIREKRWATFNEMFVSHAFLLPLDELKLLGRIGQENKV